MKIAILADIHGNFEALKAVVHDIEQFRVDRMVSLGDNVGYGPDPDSVVSMLRAKGVESVLGNHEFALRDKRGRRWLNFQAAENNEITEKLLSQENLDYSCNLPLVLEYEGGYFVHGFPKESVFRYLPKQNDDRIIQLFKEYSARLFFVGHTHDLELVCREGEQVIRKPLKKGLVTLKKQKKYIVNCGSVGQPRDGDHSAKYLLWDTVSHEIEVRFIAYDIEKAMARIAERGFPKVYGLRLR
ncbi:metallophosphoesterase family protein [Desulforhopalus sp. 52FAK]